MAIALEQVEGRTSLRLEGTVDISSAEELKAALLDGLRSAAEVHLDLSGLTYLDVTAIQLLWAARREATARGTCLTLDTPIPEAVQAGLRDAGFHAVLSLLTPSPQTVSIAGRDALNG